MLKLERRSLSRDVIIRLRTKEPFLSRNLMRAFFLAIGVHLLCCVVFKVESTSPPYENEGQHVVEVETFGSSSCTQETGLAVASGGGLLPLYLSQMQQTTPDLPTLPRKKVSYHVDTSRETTPPTRAFNRLEERPYHPGEAHFAFLAGQNPVKLRVGGQLAERQIRVDGLTLVKIEVERPEPTTTWTCVYQVQLDNQSGELFSLIRKKSSGSRDVDEAAEKILRVMRFDPSNQGLVTVGDVEVAFELGQDQTADSLLKRPG